MTAVKEHKRPSGLSPVGPDSASVVKLTAETHLQLETIQILAGPAAETRLCQGSGFGWVRVTSARERISHHESAHAVAAARLLQHVVHAVSIEPDVTIITRKKGIASGHCMHGRSEQAPMKEPVELETDSRRALRNVILLSGSFDLLVCRRHFRRLEQEALVFVDRHWRVIRLLAQKLEMVGKMNAEQIHQILAREELFPSMPWEPPITREQSLRIQ